MILTEEQRKEFEKAVKPIMKWLSDNCHPHTKVIVDYSRAELVEDIATLVTEEFVKD